MSLLLKSVVMSLLFLSTFKTALAFALKTQPIGHQHIAYYDSETDGTPLVLIHGNSASATTFEHQLTQLADHFRVIALDLPGHGQSSRSTDPLLDYSVAQMTQTLTDFLQQTGFDHGIIAGWSYGGHLALQMAPNLPNAQGFVIFGTPPIGTLSDLAQGFLPHPAGNFGFQADLTSKQMDSYVHAFMAPHHQAPFAFRHNIRITDPQIRTALAHSVMNGQLQNERHIVANLPQPLAIFHGAQEQLIDLDYFQTLTVRHLWQQQVQQIYNAGHAPHFENPHEFNDLMRKFANSLH